MSELHVETASGSNEDPELIELRERLVASRLASSPRHRLRDDSAWFRRLVRPLSVARFEAKHWGKAVWHGRSRDARRFADLFSMDRLGALVAHQAIPASQMQLVDASLRKLPSEVTAKLSPAQVMRHLFRHSGSLVVNQLERLEPSIADAVTALESVTGMYCQVNMYFTAAGAQTAKWHWDSHDVFLLQVHGEKTWKFYEREIDMPLLTSHYESTWPLRSEERAELASELTMRPGDVLYMPGGVPHQACASSSDHSLHLTMGLHGVAWLDLVQSVVARAVLECEQDLAFRQLATVEPGPKAARARARHLRRLLREVLRRADPGVAEQHLLRKAPAANPHTAAAMKELWTTTSDPTPLRASTTMRRTSCVFAVTRTAQLVHLEIGPRKLSFETRFAKALRFVEEKRSFRVDALPGKLAPEEKVALCTTLVDRGILVPSRGR